MAVQRVDLSDIRSSRERDLVHTEATVAVRGLPP